MCPGARARDFVPAFTSGYRGRLPGQPWLGSESRVQPTPGLLPVRSERKPRVTVHQHGRYSPPVDEHPSRAVPEAAVGRLAVYLRVLTSVIEQGVTMMSSVELAGAAGVISATLR